MPLWKRDTEPILRRLVMAEEHDEICRLIETDRKTLKDLVSLMDDKDAEVRSKATMAIKEGALVDTAFYFREVEPLIVPRILRFLSDGNAEVRCQAASTASNLPSQAYCGIPVVEPELIEQAIPRLLELLEDKDPGVQRSAGTSLITAAYWLLDNKREKELALGILAKLARHRDVRNRGHSAHFWIRHAEQFPDLAREAEPLLVELSRDADNDVRQSAQDALKRISTIR